MQLFLQIIIFIFGAIIGSFLNVVIYRLNTGKGMGGRSICMSCGKHLRWFELIPVLSWVFQTGKCIRCKSLISFQYPLVELITGILFLGVFNEYFPHVALIIPMIIIWCLLLVISVYDIRHKIIPNNLVYSFIAIAFLFSLFHYRSFTDLIAGVLIPLPFALIWYFSKGKAMGFGDIKLMAGIGFMLGLWAGIAAIVISFWIGALYAVFLLLAHKKGVTMKTQVPFGPFLVVGTAIAFFCHIAFPFFLHF